MPTRTVWYHSCSYIAAFIGKLVEIFSAALHLEVYAKIVDAPPLGGPTVVRVFSASSGTKKTSTELGEGFESLSG